MVEQTRTARVDDRGRRGIWRVAWHFVELAVIKLHAEGLLTKVSAFGYSRKYSPILIQSISYRFGSLQPIVHWQLHPNSDQRRQCQCPWCHFFVANIRKLFAHQSWCQLPLLCLSIIHNRDTLAWRHYSPCAGSAFAQWVIDGQCCLHFHGTSTRWCSVALPGLVVEWRRQTTSPHLV